MRHGISRIDLGRQAVLVVYEPAWAIGADRAAGAEYVREKENVEQFARLDVLDGVGATRASLDARGFLAMIDRVASSG